MENFALSKKMLYRMRYNRWMDSHPVLSYTAPLFFFAVASFLLYFTVAAFTAFWWAAAAGIAFFSTGVLCLIISGGDFLYFGEFFVEGGWKMGGLERGLVVVTLLIFPLFIFGNTALHLMQAYKLP